MSFRSCIPVLLALGLLLCTVAVSQTPEAGVFPKLTAANLNGKSFSMPGGFAGNLNIVLIAFEREQQKELDTWLAVLPKALEGFPKVSYYELPTIARLNSMARWFIDTGMRSGIHDKAQRERTITLFIDKKPFTESLHIQSEKTVYAMLIDREGKVLWRADGVANAEKESSLKAALERTAK